MIFDETTYLIYTSKYFKTIVIERKIGVLKSI